MTTEEVCNPQTEINMKSAKRKGETEKKWVVRVTVLFWQGFTLGTKKRPALADSP